VTEAVFRGVGLDLLLGRGQLWRGCRPLVRRAEPRGESSSAEAGRRFDLSVHLLLGDRCRTWSHLSGFDFHWKPEVTAVVACSLSLPGGWSVN
jgi:hypothetical protein